MKKRSLGVQALEVRALLAIDTSLDLLSGELYIGGSAADDVVELSSDLVNVRAKLTTAGKTEIVAFPTLLVRSIRFVGGTGNDRFTNQTSIGATAYGQEGNDVLIGGSGADSFWGGAGEDNLQGQAGNDYLRGDEGNDAISGGDGHDRIYGGDGDDGLRGGAGNDFMYGDLGRDVIYGEDGVDDLYGGEQRDVMDGGLGDDIVRGGLGNDTLRGGDGHDQIFGDLGDDSLLGDAGNDQLFGQDGVDNIRGGTGDDTLDGGIGDDTLLGEDGSDMLAGREGNDILFGGLGNDVLRGYDGDDDLQGDEGDDEIYGENGRDIIRGGAGNDMLDGGDDEDSLNGQDGNDLLNGRQGDDVLVGAAGNDTLYGGAGADRLSGVDGDDLLYGEEDSDIQLGGRGNDRLFGGAGADLLIGGDGLDDLWGNDDRDLLIGGNTVYDENSSQLRTILNSWIGEAEVESDDPPALANSTLVALRSNETVFSDGAADALSGNDGQDWFFWSVSDSLPDQSTTEFVSGGDVSATGWVSRLYLDVLGRTPTPAETQSILDRIDQGRSLRDLAQQLLEGDEARKLEIRQAYHQAFGTEISGVELATQLMQWYEEPTGVEGVLARFLGSAAFRTARGGTNQDAVEGMYSVLLRRNPTGTELANWLTALDEMTLEDIAYRLVTGTEYANSQMRSWYREYLHRPTEDTEVLGAINQFTTSASALDLRSNLLSSTEYLNQPYFNVTDFGAKPDDAVADSAALQSVLDIAGLVGPSVVYVGPGTFIAENLRIFGSNLKLIGPGTLKLTDRSAAVGVLTVAGNQNVIADLTIDGNAAGRPTGRAEGLRVFGTGNWVRDVVAVDAVYNDATSATGINFFVGGVQNTLERTQSLRAGYTGYRQTGKDNLYLDITSLDARIKGFNATGNGSSFTVDGGYFATNATEHPFGVSSFQVDPGPNRLVSKAVLRNVTVKGPENSGPHTTAAAKFALVNDLTIENSSFLNDAENIDSIRFAEGMGRVVMRDVFLSRQMFMQQNTNDGSGLDDPMESLYMERVTIGDGRHHPSYSMERTRVGSLTIVDSKFIGYTVAAIAWESPNAEFSRVSVQNSTFQGWNTTRTTYDIIFLNGGVNADKKKLVWTSNRRSNTGGGGAQFTPL